MTKAQRPSLRELRAIYLLVGECCELGGDPYAWRLHLIEQVCGILGAQVGISGEVQPPVDEAGYWKQSLLDIGWSSASDRRYYLRFMEENRPADNPMNASLFRLVLDQGIPFVTRLRCQLVEDRGWYGSAFYQDKVKLSHMDDILTSLRVLSAGRSHICSLIRPTGDRPFAERQRLLLHLVHEEVTRLQGMKLAGFDAPTVANLPLRLRQVLDCLLRGDSESEAARALALSTHTIHVHVKRLHRYFGTSSRGELLARSHRLLPALRQAPVTIKQMSPLVRVAGL